MVRSAVSNAWQDSFDSSHADIAILRAVNAAAFLTYLEANGDNGRIRYLPGRIDFEELQIKAYIQHTY